MTDREDQFAASLDALSRGESPPTDDDLTRFVAHVQATWQGSSATSQPQLTIADRRRMWDAIRQEATTATREGNSTMSASTVPASTAQRPAGWTATLARWQPMFSVTVMFALLAGLIGIAYTGINRQGEEPSPTVAGLIAQSTPATPSECVAYGPPPKTTEELSEMSMSDWPARHYTPLALAEPFMADQAVEVYESWMTCSKAFAEQRTSSIESPPAELSRYFSDRMQYVSFVGTYPERNPEDLEAARAFGQDELVRSGTLPLNRPRVTVWDDATGGGGFISFAPGDVYMLTDGRYGAVIGTISTDQLLALLGEGGGEDLATPIQMLTWIAFVEVDGQLLIDEFVPFCPAPIAGGPDAPTSTHATRLGECQPM